MASAFLNFLAAGTAGVCNLTLMRQKELKDGVNLQNEAGDTDYGKSKVAAKKAVT